MKYILLSLILFYGITSFSAVDLFNTYRWNRESFESGKEIKSQLPWFEWWYYKVVLPETGESFYFVYGIVNPWDTKHSKDATRSYVGFGDFEKNITVEEKYPIDHFWRAMSLHKLKSILTQLATLAS